MTTRAHMLSARSARLKGILDEVEQSRANIGEALESGVDVAGGAVTESARAHSYFSR